MASNALSILAFFALSSLFFFSSTRSDTDLIDRTCEFTVYYNESCKWTLRSDPSSSKADAPGLAAILLNKAKEISTDAQAYIGGMLQNCNNADTRLVLTSCHKYFGTAATTIDQTLDALAAKDYHEAEEIGDTIEEVSGCDDYFTLYEQVEYPSEIYKKTYHLVDLADMITNIITALKNNELR